MDSRYPRRVLVDAAPPDTASIVAVAQTTVDAATADIGELQLLPFATASWPDVQGFLTGTQYAFWPRFPVSVEPAELLGFYAVHPKLKVVGVILAKREDHEPSEHRRHLVTYNVYCYTVDPLLRCRGLGRRLLHRFQEEYIDKGVVKLWWPKTFGTVPEWIKEFCWREHFASGGSNAAMFYAFSRSPITNLLRRIDLPGEILNGSWSRQMTLRVDEVDLSGGLSLQWLQKTLKGQRSYGAAELQANQAAFVASLHWTHWITHADGRITGQPKHRMVGLLTYEVGVPAWEVLWLYVHSNYRRRNIGQQLLSALLETRNQVAPDAAIQAFVRAEHRSAVLTKFFRAHGFWRWSGGAALDVDALFKSPPLVSAAPAAASVISHPAKRRKLSATEQVAVAGAAEQEPNAPAVAQSAWDTAIEHAAVHRFRQFPNAVLRSMAHHLPSEAPYSTVRLEQCSGNARIVRGQGVDDGVTEWCVDPYTSCSMAPSPCLHSGADAEANARHLNLADRIKWVSFNALQVDRMQQVTVELGALDYELDQRVQNADLALHQEQLQEYKSTGGDALVFKLLRMQFADQLQAVATMHPQLKELRRRAPTNQALAIRLARAVGSLRHLAANMLCVDQAAKPSGWGLQNEATTQLLRQWFEPFPVNDATLQQWGRVLAQLQPAFQLWLDSNCTVCCQPTTQPATQGQGEQEFMTTFQRVMVQAQQKLALQTYLDQVLRTDKNYFARVLAPLKDVSARERRIVEDRQRIWQGLEDVMNKAPEGYDAKFEMLLDRRMFRHVAGMVLDRQLAVCPPISQQPQPATAGAEDYPPGMDPFAALPPNQAPWMYALIKQALALQTPEQLAMYPHGECITDLRNCPLWPLRVDFTTELQWMGVVQRSPACTQWLADCKALFQGVARLERTFPAIDLLHQFGSGGVPDWYIMLETILDRSMELAGAVVDDLVKEFGLDDMGSQLISQIHSSAAQNADRLYGGASYTSPPDVEVPRDQLYGPTGVLDVDRATFLRRITQGYRNKGYHQVYTSGKDDGIGATDLRKPLLLARVERNCALSVDDPSYASLDDEVRRMEAALATNPTEVAARILSIFDYPEVRDEFQRVQQDIKAQTALEFGVADLAADALMSNNKQLSPAFLRYFIKMYNTALDVSVDWSSVISLPWELMETLPSTVQWNRICALQHERDMLLEACTVEPDQQQLCARSEAAQAVLQREYSTVFAVPATELEPLVAHTWATLSQMPRMQKLQASQEQISSRLTMARIRAHTLDFVAFHWQSLRRVDDDAVAGSCSRYIDMEMDVDKLALAPPQPSAAGVYEDLNALPDDVISEIGGFLPVEHAIVLPGASARRVFAGLRFAEAVLNALLAILDRNRREVRGWIVTERNTSIAMSRYYLWRHGELSGFMQAEDSYHTTLLKALLLHFPPKKSSVSFSEYVLTHPLVASDGGWCEKLLSRDFQGVEQILASRSLVAEWKASLSEWFPLGFILLDSVLSSGAEYPFSILDGSGNITSFANRTLPHQVFRMSDDPDKPWKLNQTWKDVVRRLDSLQLVDHISLPDRLHICGKQLEEAIAMPTDSAGHVSDVINHFAQSVEYQQAVGAALVDRTMAELLDRVNGPRWVANLQALPRARLNDLAFRTRASQQPTPEWTWDNVDSYGFKQLLEPTTLDPAAKELVFDVTFLQKLHQLWRLSTVLVRRREGRVAFYGSIVLAARDGCTRLMEDKLPFAVPQFVGTWELTSYAPFRLALDAVGQSTLLADHERLQCLIDTKSTWIDREFARQADTMNTLRSPSQSTTIDLVRMMDAMVQVWRQKHPVVTSSAKRPHSAEAESSGASAAQKPKTSRQ